jgi:BirA family biotin operon repressor/biotin-[acetyl-CoA-carboxylase] ligase
MKVVLKDLNTAIIGRTILHYPSLPSTMDVARTLATEGVDEGTVILCDEQTKGRGRQERKWVDSPGGSILMSVIVRPTLQQLPQLNMMASLAVVLAIEKAAGIKSAIKWPNDVLIKGKKVAGILMENVFEGRDLQAAIVGVGLNVRLDVSQYPEIASIATSVSTELGKELSRDEVLRPLLDEMDVLYQAVKRNEDVYHRWLSYVETLGKTVRIKSGKSVEEGLAQSINPDGSITLLRTDGRTVTIATGE